LASEANSNIFQWRGIPKLWLIVDYLGIWRPTKRFCFPNKYQNFHGQSLFLYSEK